MQLNEALISRLEHLARLELSEEERAVLLRDLNNILKMVDKMEELDTSGVVPLTHVSKVVNVLRKDQVSNQLAHEVAMQNAPLEDGTFFKVPKVIDIKNNDSSEK